MSEPSGPKEQTASPQPNGWERHELEQLRRLAKLSFAEKLDWLEQAQRIANQLARGRHEPPA
jgi:hypothetical protein